MRTCHGCSRAVLHARQFGEKAGDPCTIKFHSLQPHMEFCKVRGPGETTFHTGWKADIQSLSKEAVDPPGVAINIDIWAMTKIKSCDDYSLVDC